MTEDLREIATAMERVSDILQDLRERPDLTVDGPTAEQIVRAVGDDPDTTTVAIELSLEVPAVEYHTDEVDAEAETVATDGSGTQTVDNAATLGTEMDTPDEPSVDDSSDDTDQDEYPCDECDKTFDSEQGRKIHAGQVHAGDDGDADATCNACGETFASEHGLTIHEAIAHDDTDFEPDVERVPAPVEAFDLSPEALVPDQRIAVPDLQFRTQRTPKHELTHNILLAIGAEPRDQGVDNLGKRGLRDVVAAITDRERAPLQSKTKGELVTILDAALQEELPTGANGSTLTKEGLRMLHAIVVPDARIEGPLEDWATIAAEADVPDWVIASEVDNAVAANETIRGVAAELSIDDLEVVRRLLWLGGWYQDLDAPEARGEHKYSVGVDA